MIDIRSFIRKNRRLVSGLGMILAILLIFWAVSSPAIVGVSAAKRSLPVYSVERDDKLVALSFDAAW
ncbi:MAG: deacetylase, partial [Clostridia bacterium]|nr:deacetylase [Clostridia bacterium]